MKKKYKIVLINQLHAYVNDIVLIGDEFIAHDYGLTDDFLEFDYCGVILHIPLTNIAGIVEYESKDA